MSIHALGQALPSAFNQGVCDVPGLRLNPICVGAGAVQDTVGGLAGSAAGAAVREMAQAIVGAAKEVAGAVAAFLAAPSHPDLGQRWFTANFNEVMAASGAFAALLFLLGIGRAIMTSSMAELGRVVAFTVLAFAGSTIAITLTQAFVLFTDAATAQLGAGTKTDIASLFAGLMQPLGPMPIASPGQAVLAGVLAVFIGLGMLAVYLELFVRNVMIHVIVFFVPLMLMGTIWGPTRRWAKRGAEFLAVLILSKFVLFAVIALGWSAIASFDANQLNTSWASVLTGVVLVVVAAWMPWLLFKLLPFMEAHVRSAMSRSDARAGLAAPMNAASTPVRVMQANLGRAAQLAMAVKTGGASKVAGAGAAGAGGGAAGGFAAGRGFGSGGSPGSGPRGGGSQPSPSTGSRPTGTGAGSGPAAFPAQTGQPSSGSGGSPGSAVPPGRTTGAADRAGATGGERR